MDHRAVFQFFALRRNRLYYGFVLGLTGQLQRIPDQICLVRDTYQTNKRAHLFSSKFRKRDFNRFMLLFAIRHTGAVG